MQGRLLTSVVAGREALRWQAALRVVFVGFCGFFGYCGFLASGDYEATGCRHF
jgi:hypothetical protein